MIRSVMMIGGPFQHGLRLPVCPAYRCQIRRQLRVWRVNAENRDFDVFAVAFSESVDLVQRAKQILSALTHKTNHVQRTDSYSISAAFPNTCIRQPRLDMLVYPFKHGFRRRFKPHEQLLAAGIA